MSEFDKFLEGIGFWPDMNDTRSRKINSTVIMSFDLENNQIENVTIWRQQLMPGMMEVHYEDAGKPDNETMNLISAYWRNHTDTTHSIFAMDDKHLTKHAINNGTMKNHIFRTEWSIKENTPVTLKERWFNVPAKREVTLFYVKVDEPKKYPLCG